MTIKNYNLTETDYAWTAGIIDGEGCIYIHKFGKGKNGQKNDTYSLTVAVAMTHFPTIEKLRDLWGGSFFTIKVKNSKWKDKAIWSVRSNLAKLLLTKINKYLITKHEESLMALEFLELPKPISFKETPEWLNKKQEEFYLKLRQLKKYRFNAKDYPRTNKELKKNKRTNCIVCNKEMSAFNDNGRIKTVCSDECKFKKKRKLTDEQEKELFELYKTGTMTYNQLAKKFNIPRGTVAWIKNKFK